MHVVPSESAQSLPTFRDILRARKTIAPYLKPTPLHNYPTLDALLGAEVYVKHENYQPIGAFKVRGGINLLAHMPAAIAERGVVTASTGNHGQSIAYAAKLFGIAATIIVPEGANPVKVEAMRSNGANVLFFGEKFDDCRRKCAELETEEGMYFISSGDEPLLIAGVGTHTLEVLEEEPDIDIVIVPVGGGSGVSGACLAAKGIDPTIQVIGVQSSAAPSAYQTWKHREMRSADNSTCAEGLATAEPFALPQQIMWQHLNDFLLVDDDEILQAVRIFLEKAKTLAEPAGASSLVAAMHLKEQIRGKKVALILSGGNISPQQLRYCLS